MIGGVAEDFPAAQAWFEKAAEQNHAKALYFLGVMAERGDGDFTRNLVLAENYWRKAAALGDDEAKEVLAKLEVERSAIRASANARDNRSKEITFTNVLKGLAVVGAAAVVYNELKGPNDNSSKSHDSLKGNENQNQVSAYNQCITKHKDEIIECEIRNSCDVVGCNEWSYCWGGIFRDTGKCEGTINSWDELSGRVYCYKETGFMHSNYDSVLWSECRW